MRIRGFGRAVVLAAVVVLAGTPVVTLGRAAVAPTRIVTVHAVSLNCITHGAAGCVNVAVDVTWDEAAHAGRLCIDVNDYRSPAPMPSFGCTPLGPGAARFGRHGAFIVASQHVTTTSSEDCYRAAPEDGCVPRTLTMVADVTVTPLGRGAAVVARRPPGECFAQTLNRTTVYAADVRLQVDGFGYRMPSGDPAATRNSATMVVTTVRSTSRC